MNLPVLLEPSPSIYATLELSSLILNWIPRAELWLLCLKTKIEIRQAILLHPPSLNHNKQL